MGFEQFEFVRGGRRGTGAARFIEGMVCVLAAFAALILVQLFSDPGLSAGGFKDMLFSPPATPAPAGAPGRHVTNLASTSGVRGTSSVSPVAAVQPVETAFWAPTEVPKVTRRVIDGLGPAGSGDGIVGTIGDGAGGGGGDCPFCTGPGVLGGVPDSRGTQILPPPPRPPVTIVAAVPPTPSVPVRVGPAVVGGNLIEGYLTKRVQPEYPMIARQVRVDGAVVLSALISAEGNIERLTLVSGHPLLADAAIAAVRQWKYRPYLLNGAPTEVSSTITVIFRLGQ